MSIPFTQYMLPNGAPRPVTFDSGAETERIAKKLLECGCHFDVEILTTGVISLTCEKDNDCLSIELSENGPGIERHVEKLVRNAEASLKALISKESQ